jgi:putative transcriptional regulator
MKNLIAELRQINRLTQQELADWVGVSRQTIISIEHEKYNPSLELAHRLARFFGKTIEDLFVFEIGTSSDTETTT